MKYLLDTNACIEMLRPSPPSAGDRIRARIAPLAGDDVVLCSTVRCELIFGALRSRQRVKNLAAVRMLLAQFSSLPFDDAAAEAAAEIRAALLAAGMAIGPADLEIAAIARARGLTLITHNTRDFAPIQNLTLEDWQSG